MANYLRWTHCKKTKHESSVKGGDSNHNDQKKRKHGLIFDDKHMNHNMASSFYFQYTHRQIGI